MFLFPPVGNPIAQFIVGLPSEIPFFDPHVFNPAPAGADIPHLAIEHG
jgi:hypothetical protein